MFFTMHRTQSVNVNSNFKSNFSRNVKIFNAAIKHDGDEIRSFLASTGTGGLAEAKGQLLAAHQHHTTPPAQGGQDRAKQNGKKCGS